MVAGAPATQVVQDGGRGQATSGTKIHLQLPIERPASEQRASMRLGRTFTQPSPPEVWPGTWAEEQEGPQNRSGGWKATPNAAAA